MKMESNHLKRIPALDGMRGIAIISVILFHFFSRWVQPEHSVSLYPYGAKYNFFGFGRYGVQLFFMISGFVIVNTLKSTLTVKQFWIKRIIRLWPPLLISSILIFFVLTNFDNEFLFYNGHKISNQISSITMIDPVIITKLTKINVEYVNGSYWSLWPEIQFYFFCSTIYFFDRSRFFRNYFIVIVILSFSFYVTTSNFWIAYATKNNLPFNVIYFGGTISKYFNLINFINYFSVGVFGYAIYSKRVNQEKYSLQEIITLFLFILIILFSIPEYEIRIVLAILLTLFSVFIFYKKRIPILEHKLLVKIGMCSYFLYLIHEPIGVLLINKSVNYVDDKTFLTPTIIIIFLIGLSIFFFKNVEVKIINFLKSKLLERKHG